MKYFCLYSNCIIVIGESGSVLCDLQNECYYSVPNNLADLLSFNRGTPINLNKSSQLGKIANEYFEMLVKNNLGFYTKKPHSYPSLSLDWKNPYGLDYFIYELNPLTIVSFSKIIKEINSIGCSTIEIRISEDLQLIAVEDLLKSFKQSRVRSIYLIIENGQGASIQQIQALLKGNSRVIKIFVFQCNTDLVENDSYQQIKDILLLSKEKITEFETKRMNQNSFVHNMAAFCEAQEYNIGLNRKLTVDGFGNFKNHPKHKLILGSMFEHSLNDIIRNEDLTLLWKVNNNRIEYCRNCQFRFFCFSEVELIKTEDGKIYKSHYPCGVSK